MANLISATLNDTQRTILIFDADKIEFIVNAGAHGKKAPAENKRNPIQEDVNNNPLTVITFENNTWISVFESPEIIEAKAQEAKK